MGGGHYDFDIAVESRSTTQNAFSYQGYVASADPSTRRTVHPLLNAYGKLRECMNETPIVVAMDVTRSRGNDSKLMYEKLPMFLGQIEMKGYVTGAAISFSAIGDASSGDQAPIQVGQFEADNRLDEVLSSFWIEEGGGGTGQESYELTAWYYAHQTRIKANEDGRKGYFFFVGDEGFYPTVHKDQIKTWLGVDVPEDVDSKAAFRALQEKFHVFFVYPQKTFEQRKSDIDAEIKQRVESAGGQYAGVDVRASLIWDNTNDLDLHVITPSGEEIYYAHKQSVCKGWLDVDMNVRGESVKPVENVRWKTGEAPAGHYKVYVQNFRFHDPSQAPTHYRLEVEVNGHITHYDGVISSKKETGVSSNQMVAEFDFDPTQRVSKAASPNAYANYQDDVILKQWSEVIPEAHILRIEDPSSIVDVMLGALALVGGASDLDDFLSELKARDTSDATQQQTASALGGLARSSAGAHATTSGTLPGFRGGKNGSNKQKDADPTKLSAGGRG